MTIIELIKLIAENGIMLIASAIVLWVFIRNERIRCKRELTAENQKQKDDEKREKYYNSILTRLFKRIDDCQTTQDTHGPKEDEIQEKISNSIDSILETLRESLDADRCMLVKYHNGMYDLAGNPATRMSATNERFRNGLTSFAPHFQNQFRSIFSSWCTAIREKGYIAVPTIDPIEPTELSVLKEYAKTRGIRNTFGIAVKDLDHHIIGFISVENANLELVSLEKIESCMKDKSNKISGLLTLRSN